MRLNDLKAFDAVARAGGFVRAAEFLSRAQPTVTAQVRALERAYGVELFYRGRGQAARLTPLGVKLFETTRQLFNLEGDAKALLRTAGRARGGFLRLGAISPRWAVPVMRRLAAEMPELELSLRVANSAALLEAVLDYRLDVAFLGLHEPHAACLSTRVSKPEIVFVAARGHPASRQPLLERNDFAATTLIRREAGSETRELIERDLEAYGYTPARILEFGSREAALLAIEAGLGIAPVSLEEVPANADLAVLRCVDFRTFGEVHLACLRARRHLPIVQRVFEEVGTGESLDAAAAEGQPFGEARPNSTT